MNIRASWIVGLAASAAIIWTVPAWSTDPSISVVPSSSSVSLATSFAVDVLISGASDLYGFQFDLTFNPNVLQASSVTEGSFLSGGGSTFFVPGTIDNAGGNIFATADTLLSPVPGVNGSGTLAIFDFISVGSGNSPLDLANVIALDSTLDTITVSTSGASVSVPAVAVPEPGGALILGLGVAAILISRRRKYRSAGNLDV
jgi:general secretion pathway protein D